MGSATGGIKIGAGLAAPHSKSAGGQQQRGGLPTRRRLPICPTAADSTTQARQERLVTEELSVRPQVGDVVANRFDTGS